MLQDGKTALHLAARYDHVEVVKMLVHYRAAVDIRNKVQCRDIVNFNNKQCIMSASMVLL